MKKIWVLLIFLFTAIYSWGFEIVYPKAKEVTINSRTTFFVGSSKESITINGEQIKLHPTGAFAYFVNLEKEINSFIISTKTQTEVFKIKKSFTQKGASNNQKFIKYDKLKYFVVNIDRTPLRSTPVNEGLNRITHLQKGVFIISDGEKGAFYRVKLNDAKYVWVAKNNVKETGVFTPAVVKRYSFSETSSAYELTFDIDKKVPYEIKEGDTYEIVFYNTDRENRYLFPYSKKSKSKILWGYSGRYSGDKFILKIKKPVKVEKDFPLKGITIAIDPGHGGNEKGAIGCLGDKEKDIVLKISRDLEKELKSRGAKVVLTRKEDKTVGLYERTEIANRENATFFISIHNNALPDSLNPNKHRGTSVYYYEKQAKDFGQSILNSMVFELGTNNDGLRQQSFAVIRNTNAISVLIEVAYLINPYDNALLTDEKFQKNAAKSIANGIEKYLLNSI